MPILYEKKNAVGVMTMSRPDMRNCWGPDFYAELGEHLTEMARDDEIRCAILTGDDNGKAFSAGANMKDPNAHLTATVGGFIAREKKPSFPELLSDFPKPIIAAVNGYAVGAGCMLACCSDLVVASDRAEWRMPQVSLGIIPAHGGAVRFARIFGKNNAMKLCLGFPIGAEEGFRVGLAQWLVPHEQLMEQAFAIAEHVAKHPPLATRLVKESMVHGMDIGSIAEATLVDQYRSMALGLTEDSKESHAAWRERRPAVYKGR